MRRFHRKLRVGAARAAGAVLLSTAPALAQDGGVSVETVYPAPSSATVSCPGGGSG